ncbi:TPA: glycine-rich domain-containing protein [Raoultella ornithinolytica]
MALSLLASNNAKSVLAAGISASATVLTVSSGMGSLFPSPTPGANYFKLTIIDAATKTITEIVHVTSVSGDVMTVIRGQEGTTPRVWSTNDIVANMMTAGSLLSCLQVANNLSEISLAGSSSVKEALLNLGSSDGTLNGRLIGIKTFADSGTYTKSEGTRHLIVEIVAGGGSSRTVSADSASTGGSQPGFSGQYNKSRFNASDVPSSVNVTIGGGGFPGNAGGDSSFGSLVTVAGGYPGAEGMSSSGAFISGSAYRYTGLVNTSSGLVLASSGGETQSPQVMQVTAGTATGFIAYPSQFPGGQYGRGADGRYAGAGTTATGLSGNKGFCIVYEYA